MLHDNVCLFVSSLCSQSYLIDFDLIYFFRLQQLLSSTKTTCRLSLTAAVLDGQTPKSVVLQLTLKTTGCFVLSVLLLSCFSTSLAHFGTCWKARQNTVTCTATCSTLSSVWLDGGVMLQSSWIHTIQVYSRTSQSSPICGKLSFILRQKTRTVCRWP